MNLPQLIRNIWTNPRFLKIIPACIIMALTSCHGQYRQEKHEFTEASDSDTITIVLPVDEQIQIPLPLNHNPEELIRFMAESEDSIRYNNGIFPLILKTAPEYVYELMHNNYSGFIVVDKSRMKVIFFDKYGLETKIYSMACSRNYGTKHKKGDLRTPEGFFHVEGVYDSSEWLFTDDNGVTSKKKGQFGPRFIRLRIPGTTHIGIHGTCAPWSIGTRTSHGCIRVKNENILELVELVEVGMPVIIVPGRKDLEQNKSEGVDIPWIATYYGAKEPKPRISNMAEDIISSDTASKNDTTTIMPLQKPLDNDTIILEKSEEDFEEI